jgi:hypothetical protein
MALASLPTRARATHESPSPLVRAAIGLNVWCVIEPLVGIAWQWALARSVDTTLGSHHWMILGSSLWLVYAADRWLDARPGKRPVTARHAFWACHRDPLAMLWSMVLLASVALALWTLNELEWVVGAVLLAFVATYMFAVHRLGLAGGFKKAAVALIYGLGVGVFLWPSAPDLGWVLSGQAALAALAGCNLAAVAVFERTSRVHDRQRIALPAALLGGIVLCSSVLVPAGPATLLVGVSGSMFALAALLLWPNRIDSELAHALCDVVLLATLLSWS